jgi:ketosteroid isomerase-like protein
VKLHSRILVAAALVAASALVQAEGLTTQDYLDIEQLYAQYNHAIDNCDAEEWAATFTSDGTFMRFTGREALVGFVKQWCGTMNGANRRHWNTNLRITPSKDGANGTVMLMLLDVSARPAAIANTGTYTDTLVRTPDGWRFTSRMIKGDAPPAAPAPQSKP